MITPSPNVHAADQAPSIGRRIGFVLAAIVVGLVLIGQAIFLVRVVREAHLVSGNNALSIPRSGSLAHRLDVALRAALGPSDRGVRRFAVTAVRVDRREPKLKDVTVTWAINDDLAAGSVGNGAEEDVYAMLRNLYSAHLPVAVVRLIGTYPLNGGQESVVMRLSLAHSVAGVIGRAGWSSIDAEGLWPLVRRSYVQPSLEPITSG